MARSFAPLLPFEASFHEVLDCLAVDVLLLAVGLVDVVVGEGLVAPEPGLRFSRGLGDADLAGVNDLPRKLRPDPHGHTDRGVVLGGRTDIGRGSHDSSGRSGDRRPFNQVFAGHWIGFCPRALSHGHSSRCSLAIYSSSSSARSTHILSLLLSTTNVLFAFSVECPSVVVGGFVVVRAGDVDDVVDDSHTDSKQLSGRRRGGHRDFSHSPSPSLSLMAAIVVVCVYCVYMGLSISVSSISLLRTNGTHTCSCCLSLSPVHNNLVPFVLLQCLLQGARVCGVLDDLFPFSGLFFLLSLESAKRGAVTKVGNAAFVCLFLPTVS